VRTVNTSARTGPDHHQTVDFTNACSLGRSKVGGGKVVERQKRDEYHLGLDEKGATRR
jgi:hypothetical protein